LRTLHTDQKELEGFLGFGTEFFFLGGLPKERIRMEYRKNSRVTSTAIEEKIGRHWRDNRPPGAFDGDRARFEGAHYDKGLGELTIFFSHEKYRTYSFLEGFNLPRTYQARLFSVNGVVITKDNKIPIGLRKAESTNQGRMWHIVPAGFVDMSLPDQGQMSEEKENLQKWHCELPHVAALRELSEELSMPSEQIDTSKMSLVGIVYNSMRNFDCAATIIIPSGCDSSEIDLRGEEHENLRFIDTTYDGLRQELLKMSRYPNTGSGHLRGDIALVIGHLYGHSKYIATLESILTDVILDAD
jgi:hypothetical protein